MRWLFKIILLFLAAMPAWATSTRSQALGLNEATAYMKPSNLPFLFQNPARLVEYENLFFFEHHLDSNGEGVNSGGVVLHPTGFLTLSLLTGYGTNERVLNDTENPRGLFYQGSMPGDDDTLVNAESMVALDSAIINSPGLSLAETARIFAPANNLLQRKNLLGIMAFSFSKVSLAALVGYGQLQDVEKRSQSIEEDITLKKSELTTTLGVEIHSIFSFLPLISVALERRNYSLNNVYSQSDLEGNRFRASLVSDEAHDDSIIAMAELSVIRRTLFRFFFRYDRLASPTRAVLFAQSPELNLDLEDNNHRGGSSYSYGMAVDFKANNSVTVITGFHYRQKTLKNIFDGYNHGTNQPRNTRIDEEIRHNNLSLHLALQAELHKSLQMRFGISHQLHSRYDLESLRTLRNENTATRLVDKKKPGPESRVALGLSLNFYNFTIDWLTSAGFFRDGPHFLTNKKNDFSTAIAMTYKFGKLPLF